MKQKNKASLIVTLTGVFYLVILYFIPGKNFTVTALLTIFSLAIILACIYFTNIRRVEKLKRKVNKIAVSPTALTERISMTGNDETKTIALAINTLLDNVAANNLKLETDARAATQELQESNTQLKQEISAKSRSDKMVIDHEYYMQLGKHDELTSLPNGIQFNEYLNKAITYSKRRSQNLAVLLINLDLFKLVHDTFGNENSSLILKEVSKRLKNTLRKEDILAKLDGDEFIILLSDIGKPKFASAVAEKILSACSQLLKLDAHEFTLTASIGISVYPHDGDSLEELVENADRALFKAKQSGGNTYQFHAEEIQVEALEYIQLEAALRKAIHNNELALYYQPRFRTSTGNITSVEALMRWEHPALGIINPAKFIPLAEDSGLIMQIGEWALHEACQRISYWQKEGYEHVSIALKLSPKQFNHPEMVKLLAEIPATYGINPKYIELEVTEKTVMENVEAAALILEKIKETGVQVSIDHFGTGYTVISYLKQFPLSAIKIDQSYIKGIPDKPNDVAITSALIALAHKLGLEVIAEGVESAEQVQFLSAQNCDLLQGYFLSHPVSAQKIILQFKKLQDEVLG
jgi:diguanylate cyclase (GGDEF)-like protein